MSLLSPPSQAGRGEGAAGAPGLNPTLCLVSTPPTTSIHLHLPYTEQPSCPLPPRLDEVKGLLEFLACEPFYHGPAWRGLVQSEFSRRSPTGLLAMRTLLRGVMLRRTKADVGEWGSAEGCKLGARSWERFDVVLQGLVGLLVTAVHVLAGWLLPACQQGSLRVSCR